MSWFSTNMAAIEALPVARIILPRDLEQTNMPSAAFTRARLAVTEDERLVKNRWVH